MRLLSNLLKQKYIVSNGDNARVMNYDRLIAEKLEVFAKNSQSSCAEDGFVGGLSVEQIEIGPDPESLRNNALEEANEILENAKLEAQQLIAQAILDNESGREVATKEGFEVGYNAGFQQGMQEIQLKEEELEQKQHQLESYYEEQKKKLEPELVDTILDVFQKVFHIQFEKEQKILVHLIGRAIQNINNSKEFVIKVSKSDLEFVLAHKDKLAGKIKTASVFEIVSDHSLKAQECIIETDAGVFECSVDVELEQLIKSIKALSI